MKHQEPVLCVRKNQVIKALATEGLMHGIHTLRPDRAAAYIEPHLEYRKRADLETDIDYYHFIPYILVPRTEIAPDTGLLTLKLATYRRPAKGDGEARIQGKLSVGWGGHVELEDASYGDEINPETQAPDLKFMETIYKCLHREIGEEMGVRITDDGENHGEMQIANTHNVIVELDTDVGLYHLGMLFLAMLPPGLDAYPTEKDHEDLGYVPVSELKDKYWDELEGWSKMAVTALMKNQEDHNARVRSGAQ